MLRSIRIEQRVPCGLNFSEHAEGLAASGLLRGKLCEQLTNREARALSPGEAIYSIGDPAHHIYFLRKGLAKTSIISAGGKELILGIHAPGEIFGELCFCKGKRREQSISMEHGEVVEIHFENLISGLQSNRQVLLDVLQGVCRRLSEAYDQLLILSFDKTMERLIRKLLDLAEHLGEPAPEGVSIMHYVKQEELAQMIGAPREVVSSLLNQLRERDLVSYSRKRRLTVNPDALRTYLTSISGHP
jgi:CRP/FNR family transcriptional regulator, cyclic AMP receptor protein